MALQKKEDQYIYETDLMDGAFHAILIVSDKGAVSGKVIDVMNDEEYHQLRSRQFHGAYVTRVRDAYEQWLRHIAENVCDEVLFASDQANRITQLILNQYDVKPDFPWDEKQYQTYGTFRHADTRKWFALIMNILTVLFLFIFQNFSAVYMLAALWVGFNAVVTSLFMQNDLHARDRLTLLS